MGILLADPITEALKDALSAHAALAEVRRVLEIIVPLAYRPPIKVRIILQRCDIVSHPFPASSTPS